MDARQVFETLRTSGLTLYLLDGGNIRAAPPEAITPAARALIREHKAALVELLRQGTTPATSTPAPETATTAPPPEPVAPTAPATTCQEDWETGTISDEPEVSPLAGQHATQDAPGMSRLPPLWAEGLTRLQNMRPPPDIDLRRWRAIQQAAVTFERDGWAAKAFELGWSVGEVFGVHAGAPLKRFDHMGLLVLLASPDTHLVELQHGEAIFECGRTRATQRLRKGEIFVREQRLLWEEPLDGTD
ncbi:MAG: hypothetical protein H7836_09440 [Magnetococcus sp. YQC-3]